MNGFVRGQGGFSKSKVFNFETYTTPTSEGDDDHRIRSSIQLEKQRQFMQHDYNKIPPMPPLISSHVNSMPVKISSKVSPSSSSSTVFSITELMRRDERCNPPQTFQARSLTSIAVSEPVSVLQQQNININMSDPHHSLLLFNSAQPPDLVKSSRVSCDENKPGLLLIPAASIAEHPIRPKENAWNSLRMSETSLQVTGMRSCSSARIRFDDLSMQHSVGRSVKSEPSTPTLTSPYKKSILKRQSNDSMERYASLETLLQFIATVILQSDLAKIL